MTLEHGGLLVQVDVGDRLPDVLLESLVLSLKTDGLVSSVLDLSEEVGLHVFDLRLKDLDLEFLLEGAALASEVLLKSVEVGLGDFAACEQFDLLDRSVKTQLLVLLETEEVLSKDFKLVLYDSLSLVVLFLLVIV